MLSMLYWLFLLELTLKVLIIELELGKKQVRRAGSLLAIIVSLFIEGIIKISVESNVSWNLFRGIPPIRGNFSSPRYFASF
jgi:hypothetical protein